MNLVTLLKPEAVRVVGRITSKKRLFQELGEVAASCYGLNFDDAVEALQDREGIGPTGVGGGVALPHARLPGLESVVGVFLRVSHALDFDAVDKQPVDLIFALFAPEAAGAAHLKSLAVVSRKMRDSHICSKLRANDEPATLHAILTGLEDTKAA